MKEYNLFRNLVSATRASILDSIRFAGLLQNGERYVLSMYNNRASFNSIKNVNRNINYNTAPLTYAIGLNLPSVQGTWATPIELTLDRSFNHDDQGTRWYVYPVLKYNDQNLPNRFANDVVALTPLAFNLDTLNN